MDKKLSIIIPFWNESRTLPTLILALQELASLLEFEVVFVDDGSTDDSLELVKTLASGKFGSLHIVAQENKGKTGAVKTGLLAASGTHAVVLDADLELLPQDLPSLWEIVRTNKCEVVFGYRQFLAHSSFTWRYAQGNYLLSGLFGLLFNRVITDLMCGFKLLPLDQFREIPLKSARFGLEVEIPIYLWRRGSKIYEVPVQYVPRTRSEGKTIGILDAIRIAALMVWYRMRFRHTIRDRVLH